MILFGWQLLGSALDYCPLLAAATDWIQIVQRCLKLGGQSLLASNELDLITNSLVLLATSLAIEIDHIIVLSAAIAEQFNILTRHLIGELFVSPVFACLRAELLMLLLLLLFLVFHLVVFLFEYVREVVR